ncbi:NAD(P)-dependent oxidoreductase [Streptomyces sp. NPDC058368]|uniref:NAD(P)-dependent oxidoreductase n=1 Tax=Streptomyces sp. NPDC058368 TaxID=3346461 RepID=UPI00364A464A
MRIAVIGAAGMAGSRVVTEAADRGRALLAVYRSTRPDALPPGVSPVAGDADDTDAMAALFDGADAVVAATRPPVGREHTIAATTTALLDAAAKTGTRILVIGGAGPLTVPGHPGRLVVDDPAYVPPQWRTVAAASSAQLAACRAHEADWTYLSPPAVLEPGRRTGAYRRGTTTLLTAEDGTSRIAAEDLAVAVLDELEVPYGERHFTVAY